MDKDTEEWLDQMTARMPTLLALIEASAAEKDKSDDPKMRFIAFNLRSLALIVKAQHDIIMELKEKEHGVQH